MHPVFWKENNMSEIIKLDNGVDYVEIQNTEGKRLTVLAIDKADKTITERFAHLIKNLTSITERVEAEEKDLKQKYTDIPNEDVNIERIIDTSRLHIKYIKECIDEINGVFGENTIQEVFSENYALNEDFIPDEYALLEFVDKIIPLMNRLFNERFETNKKKYSANRKHGKHNWTKEELIRAQMGKSNE